MNTLRLIIDQDNLIYDNNIIQSNQLLNNLLNLLYKYMLIVNNCLLCHRNMGIELLNL